MLGPHRRRLSNLALLAACALLAWSASGFAQSTRFRTLNELVNDSDQIFTATCTDKRSEFRSGTLITTYKLKPKEMLKGELKLDKAGEFAFEELGGSISTPIPITQFLPGMANFEPNEEVLLFTVKPKPVVIPAEYDPEPSRFKYDQVRIVGRGVGRYTIFRHPETGEELVSTVGVQPMPGSVRTPLLNRIGLVEKAASADPATSASLAPEELAAMRRQLGDKIEEVRQENAAALAEEARVDPRRVETVLQFEELDQVRQRIKAEIQRQQQQGGN